MAAISKIYVTLTQSFMSTYQGYMYMFLQDMKFLRVMLSPEQLYTDDMNDDDNNDNNDDNDTNDDDNDTRWTNHDCIGSLALC